MLLRIPKILLCPRILRLHIPIFKRGVGDIPKVKILSSDFEDVIKISFKYGHNYNIKVEKDQTLQHVLKRIKLVVNLQRKKEEIKRAVLSKYAASGSEGIGGQSIAEDEETDDEDIDVSLIKDNNVIDVNIKNKDAWGKASSLKIGDVDYEILHNTPSVLQLTLPDHILVGCPFRPHFIFECTVLEDCEFHWYRTKSYSVTDKSDDDNWLKVAETFMYKAVPEDVGHLLKLMCIPKNGENVGQPFYTLSKHTVEAGPDIYPFEERQILTRELADSDCIRCMTYNILANIYVENRKFPYCSRKILDVYFRKQLLLRELPGYNADIICMQEAQERVFTYDILPIMTKLNMDGFFSKKGGKRYDGLAFLYRTTKFNVVKTWNVYLNKIISEKEIFNELLLKVSGYYKDMSKLLAQDTVLQLVLLEHIDKPKKKVLVANTHLYSNKDMPEVRLFQSALCIAYSEHVIKTEEADGPIAFLFCGDFNSLPNSAAYEFITMGSSTCSSNNSAMKDTDKTLRHNEPLTSACGTPLYTNYTESFNGCLDYIFYNQKDFNVSEVLPLPPHDKITEQVGLPNEFFPSDHIPLVCTLKWKSWNED